MSLDIRNVFVHSSGFDPSCFNGITPTPSFNKGGNNDFRIQIIRVFIILTDRNQGWFLKLYTDLRFVNYELVTKRPGDRPNICHGY